MNLYEKKYKEALEGIRELYNSDCDMIRVKRLKRRLKLIFPELKESEDERMRKEIIDFLRLPHSQFVGKRDHEKWIAWFEKQGEQKKVSIWKHWKNGIAGNGEGRPVYLIKTGNTYTLSSVLSFECDYIELSELDNLMLEKQGEKKPTDKVEPKFKVRDWIVDKSGHIQQVLDFRGGIYTCTHNSFTIDCESNYHLWTIEDAKDGDVLVHNGCPFIFMGIKDGIVQALEENLLEGTNPVNFGEPKIDKDYQPATKEQRAMLFHKMKEEGYEWDADKKELKKIEPKKVNVNKVIEWINSDKVIEWLKCTVRKTSKNYGVYKETHLTLPYNSIEDLIDDFKEDFGL